MQVGAVNDKTQAAYAQATALAENEQIDVQEETAASATESAEAVTEDVVEISEQTRKSINELEDMQSYYSRLSEELERAREQGDGMAAYMKEKITCLRIAMRIISGDKVPKEDHRYLMDKDPELYSRAISMRMKKHNPKNHDRISEDEEEEKAGDSDGSDRRINPGAGSPQTAATPEGGADVAVADVAATEMVAATPEAAAV